MPLSSVNEHKNWASSLLCLGGTASGGRFLTGFRELGRQTARQVKSKRKHLGRLHSQVNTSDTVEGVKIAEMN